jgi:hypothetical protein
MRDNFELLNLTEEQQAAVQKATGMARKAEGRHVVRIGTGEAVAFRLRSAEIAWTFDGTGGASARGVVAL